MGRQRSFQSIKKRFLKSAYFVFAQSTPRWENMTGWVLLIFKISKEMGNEFDNAWSFLIFEDPEALWREMLGREKGVGEDSSIF